MSRAKAQQQPAATAPEVGCILFTAIQLALIIQVSAYLLYIIIQPGALVQHLEIMQMLQVEHYQMLQQLVTMQK